MAKFHSTITQDNFDSAFSFVSKSALSIKRKEFIKKIARPVSCCLFLFLTLLLVIGATYKYASPEELVVFEKLGFLVKPWTVFSNLFTKPDMVWYIYWAILIVAAYVIPIALTAIVSIIITLCMNKTFSQIEGTPAEKAKQLHNIAVDISKNCSNYDSGSTKKLFKTLFVLCVAAFLIYAFLTLKMFSIIKLILGFVVAMLLLYFVYGLFFSLFYAINKLFYKQANLYYLKNLTDTYWVSVDPEEKKRREIEEQKRKAEEERKRKEKEERERERASQKSSYSSNTGGSVNKLDSFTWTREYVKNNEEQLPVVLNGVNGAVCNRKA